MTLPFKMKMSILCIAVLGVLCTGGYGRPSIKTSTHLLLSDHNPIPDGDFPKILTIVIQNSSIRELPPDIFRGFYNVEQIIIISSNLSVIRVGAFRNLSRLKQLIINGNRITKIHNNSFDGLVSLEHLHLGNNNITLIEKEVLSPLIYSLTSLHLPNNAIAALTTDFLVGTRIREFNLEGNPLDLSDGPILASEYLENLNLQSCNINNLSSNAFTFLPNLTNLDLARNSFPVLPAGLSKDNLRLNHLDYECNISARNAKVLCVLTIRGVELSCRGDNSNTPLECTYHRNTRIREFNLEGNPLDLSDGPILASEYLENLNLQSCNINNLSSKAFAFLPNLTNLDLAWNFFTVLPAGLSKDNLRLNHLDYECNIRDRNDKVLCLLTSRGVELSCRGDNSNTPLECTYHRNSETTVPVVDDNLLKQKDNLSGSETNDDEGQEGNKGDTTNSDFTVYVQESSTSDAGDQNVQSREVPKSHNAEDQNVLKIFTVAGFVFGSCLIITAISVYVIKIYRRHRNVLVAEQVPFIPH